MKIQPKNVWSGDSSGSQPRDDEVRRWLRSREEGCRGTLGHNNRLNRQLYSSVAKVRSWNPMDTTNHQHHGGIFNFDFSKDGSVLVAACEKRSLLIFDPLNGQLIASKEKAHNDCVNCVRFLDSRVFATCSDDTTVCLWDVRYMKHKIRSLQAHSNWVKNIEYDSSSGLLVTSGFDGSVFTWDINRYTDSEETYKQVFHTPGLMRMKLTPDASKLVVATGSGYLMVIHDLDLSSLSQELDDFMPNMYRLMQQTNTPIPQAVDQNHVFTQGRNRVELISDFPVDNKADMIASLEVHPQGWCVVSRNTSTYEVSEWTCVHDIQVPYGTDDECQAAEQQPRGNTVTDQCTSRDALTDERTPSGNNPTGTADSRSGSTEPSRTASPAFVLSVSINEDMTSAPSISQSNASASTAEGSSNTDTLLLSSSERVDLLRSSSVHLDLSQSLVTPDSTDDSDSDVDSNHGLSSLESRPLSARDRSTTSTNLLQLQPPHAGTNSCPTVPTASRADHRGENSERASEAWNIHPSPIDVLPSLPRLPDATGASLYSRWDSPNDSAFMRFLILDRNKGTSPDTATQIHHNRPRLTHYVEELNVGRGFIKEVSFSSDGRMICSPYGFGIRLLAFDADCSEMCDVIPSSPVKLYTITSNMSHTSAVVTTKFSPLHCMFVSGCLKGKIDFHQPLL